MATRLPYAQGESGNVVIVGTCLDIARTSGRDCRASSVSGTRSSQFTRFSRTAWRSPRNAGSTWSESRGNVQISSWANCIQWHCGEDTLWSASAPAPNFVWPLWSHSLCASGASPPQDCSSFPIPCKFHLYESTCCETILRLLRARCSESNEPFEHRFGDGAVCWALLHKFLTKLLAWVVNLLCWQQQPAKLNAAAFWGILHASSCPKDFWSLWQTRCCFGSLPNLCLSAPNRFKLPMENL